MSKLYYVVKNKSSEYLTGNDMNYEDWCYKLRDAYLFETRKQARDIASKCTDWTEYTVIGCTVGNETRTTFERVERE